ncbi:MAG: lipid-binding SYLF domain-containing protein [Deltaproteobacteria bacterium]|nr:lipid-binding SYLF domain-containing protein [Deltaproteobacteria bacterium]
MKRSESSRFRVRHVVILLMAGVFFLMGAVAALADDSVEAKNLVEKARMSFNSFQSAEEMGGFRDLIKKAKGVFISPSVLKGAFIVGASGGSGVFLMRDNKTRKWFGPAFYTMGEASFGLQIGGSASEVILLAMTDRGVTAFLANNFKLGANGSVAVGPVGVGAAAASANLSADILSFSRSKGLFGGVSVDGAVVGVRGSLNDAYYGKKVSPTDILIKHDVANKGAAGLIKAIDKASAAK